MPNEFLVFDDGEEQHRIRFAYYKLIERKMLLEKMRTEVHFLLPGYRRTQDRLFRHIVTRSLFFLNPSNRDTWALIRVAHVPPS